MSPVPDIGGPDLSSLRPSSAKYSFARGNQRDRGDRDRAGAAKVQDTPGPASYNVRESGLSKAAISIGNAPQIVANHEYQYNNDYALEECNARVPDSNNFRYKSAACPIFGTEERCGEAKNAELIRDCPQSRFGQAGPGFMYTPDDRKVRPQSAPSYSMRQPRRSQSKIPSTDSGAKVSPQSYNSEGAIGVQKDSRRKSRPSSSFGRASRFPMSKEAGGQQTAENKKSDAADVGLRHKRAPAATFGSASREGSRPRMVRGPQDQHPTTNMAPPRMPHPTVAPQAERIRYAPVGAPRP